jgi:hypothetical protein
MTCDTSATPYQGWLACFQKSKLHQTCARAFFIGQMTLFALSTKMPRIFERRVGQGKGERCSLLLREVAL